MTKYSVALLGLGRIAYSLGLDRKREQPASHSRAFDEHPGFSLVAGCDIDPEKCQNWQRKYKDARIYPDYSEMLSSDRYDVLVIALPEKLHLSAFEACCAAGAQLIVLEKPIAASLEDARKITALAQKYDIPVMVNHERRFARDYRWLRELIQSGTLGEVRSVRGRILTNVPAVTEKDNVEGDGSLIHDGTHLLDIIEFLCQSEVSILSARGADPREKGIIMGVVAQARISNAALYLEFGMGVDHFQFEIDIDMERGRALIGNGILELHRSRPSPYYEAFRSLVKDRRVRPFGKTGYFSGMADACYRVLSEGRKIESGIAESLHYLELIAGIRDLIKKEKV